MDVRTVRKHKYICIDYLQGKKWESEDLPIVLKEARKCLKIAHGNKVRTALLEDNIYRVSGTNRKDGVTKHDIAIMISHYLETIVE